MTESGNPGPGYKKDPGHKVEIVPGPGHLKVMFAGEIIADTENAVTVIETNYAPVHYIPRTDVRSDVLEASSHATYCPFKGEARYWSITLGGDRSENAVWAYDTPYDEVAALKDRMAFYPGKGADIVTE